MPGRNGAAAVLKQAKEDVRFLSTPETAHEEKSLNQERAT